MLLVFFVILLWLSYSIEFVSRLGITGYIGGSDIVTRELGVNKFLFCVSERIVGNILVV